jgi:hypothetical protein
MRVLEKEVPDLQKLPAGYSRRNEIPKPLDLCPSEAPVKSFNVVAMDYPAMKLNPKAPDAIEVDFERTIRMTNPDAKIYALEEEVATVATGLQPMPLTLRANVGDCIKVKLTNKMKEGRASFSAIGLAFDPKDSLGANVGNNLGDQTIAPGESRTYTYYADPSLGETASLVWDWGNVMTHPRNGLYGALVIGPKGATYRDPKTGADISTKNSWVADVIVDRTIQGYEHRTRSLSSFGGLFMLNHGLALAVQNAFADAAPPSADSPLCSGGACQSSRSGDRRQSPYGRTGLHRDSPSFDASL